MYSELRLKKFCKGIRKRVQLVIQKYPSRIQCNVCGWNGRIFCSDAWHPHTICPNCGSQVRHRLMIAAVATLDELGRDVLFQGKRILHFAPEKALSGFFKDGAGEYVTADLFKDNADLYRDSVDLVLDISDMKNVAEGSFDLVIACDVLEHVSDDVSALQEIRRILSMQGWAILTVPQKDDQPTKYEDSNITTPAGRKQAFGQEDHLRIYGGDFGLFLETNGFNVKVVDNHSFDDELVEKHVLFPPILSNHPLATNYRKVFFAQKK